MNQCQQIYQTLNAEKRFATRKRKLSKCRIEWRGSFSFSFSFSFMQQLHEGFGYYLEILK